MRIEKRGVTLARVRRFLDRGACIMARGAVRSGVHTRSADPSHATGDDAGVSPAVAGRLLRMLRMWALGRVLRPLGGCRSLSGHGFDVEVGVLSCQDVERHISLPHTRYFRVGALSERWCHSPQQGGYLADKARAWCRHRWQCLVRALYVFFFYSFWYFYNVWHGILPFGYLCLILGMGYFLT